MDGSKGLFEQLTNAQNQVRTELNALKASPNGEKIAEIDAKAGHVIRLLRGLTWLASTLPILLLSYIACSFVEGWNEIAIITVTILLITYVVWRSFLYLFRPSTASEAVLEEMEERLGPVLWLARMSEKLFGRGHTAAN